MNAPEWLVGVPMDQPELNPPTLRFKDIPYGGLFIHHNEVCLKFIPNQFWDDKAGIKDKQPRLNVFALHLGLMTHFNDEDEVEQYV